MSKEPSIPISDEELDALMAQLETETADMVVVPKVVEPPANVFVPDDPDADDVAAAIAELDKSDPAPEPVAVAPAPEPAPAPKPVPKAVETPVAPPKAVAPAPTPEPVQKAPAAPDSASVTDISAAITKVAAAAPAPAANKVRAPMPHTVDMKAFAEDIRISSTNIDTAMMEQASLLAYKAEESAKAEAQAARYKLRFDIIEAGLYEKHRSALATSAEKVTEKMIESKVKTDPDYSAAKQRVIEAEAVAATCKGCVAALKDRKDMLVQIGADRREEGKGQMRILEIQEQNRDMKDRAARAGAMARAGG